MSLDQNDILYKVYINRCAARFTSVKKTYIPPSSYTREALLSRILYFVPAAYLPSRSLIAFSTKLSQWDILRLSSARRLL
jgi:hypothetical protein